MSKAKPPSTLIEAFRAIADRDVESIAILLIDDGFAADIMRVLAAWPNVELRWSPVSKDPPDAGKPTAAAWKWLVAGTRFDMGELAAAAGVSLELAREKITMLLGARLSLPDGSLSKTGHLALQRHAAQSLGLKQQKTKNRDDKGDAN